MKPQAYNARKKLTENEAPCLLCEEQERHTDSNTNKQSKRSRKKQQKQTKPNHKNNTRKSQSEKRQKEIIEKNKKK